MKYRLSYTPRHKQILEQAINLALAWHVGDIEPVCQVMLNAFKIHRTPKVNLKEAIQNIRRKVQIIREIDQDGVVFGDFEILKGIQFTESGKDTITVQEALALENLMDCIFDLIIGKLSSCISWTLAIVHGIDRNKRDDLDRAVNSLHRYCWNLEIYQENGIHYDEESDIVYDILQVLRYTRYLNSSEEEKKELEHTVISRTPYHWAEEALIQVIAIP